MTRPFFLWESGLSRFWCHRGGHSEAPQRRTVDRRPGGRGPRHWSTRCQYIGRPRLLREWHGALSRQGDDRQACGRRTSPTCPAMLGVQLLVLRSRNDAGQIRAGQQTGGVGAWFQELLYEHFAGADVLAMQQLGCIPVVGLSRCRRRHRAEPEFATTDDARINHHELRLSYSSREPRRTWLGNAVCRVLVDIDACLIACSTVTGHNSGVLASRALPDRCGGRP
jgi:hypothetical protein